VEDDGAGFNDQKAVRDGLGLGTMQFRARLIGANLETSSTPGAGVRVCCTLFYQP
jgi:signal transduction histidine kinase